MNIFGISGRRFPSIRLLTVLLCLSGSACNRTEPGSTGPGEAAAPEAAAPLFQDVAEAAGVQFIYRNGEEANHYSILELPGGGVAVFDYDKDGWLDIFLPGGGAFTGPEKKRIEGRRPALYRNLGNWKFADVTEQVGLAQPRFFSHGAAVGDYNRDGWPDLVVTGYGGLALYANVAAAEGQRRFENVTQQAGLDPRPFWTVSAAWADFDSDGWADLYLCQYVDWSWDNNPKCPGYVLGVEQDVCSPKVFQSLPDILYRNLGGGKFADVSKSAGLRVARADNDYGKGLSVLAFDTSADQKPDLYVANDTTDNFLYLNESQPGHIHFREAGMEMGVARDDRGLTTGSMGLDAADMDGSGEPTLWVTNFEDELHGLYRMVGQGKRKTYLYSTEASGIAAIGQIYVGWGTGFLDLENDGWQDLVITNGHVYRHPQRGNLAQKPVLLHNRGRGRFTAITDEGGAYFRTVHRGRGLAIGDLDNDGRPDLVISHVNEPAAVLRNVAPQKYHWLGVQLVGQDGRPVAGTRLTLQTGDKRQRHFARGGGSYASHRDERILMGLGTAAASGTLTVEWTSGEPRIETWDNLPIDRYHMLIQGQGKPRPQQTE